MSLQIEKNIPIPIPAGPHKNGQAELIRSMEVGDSIFFASQIDARRFARHLHAMLHDTEFRQLQRKVHGGWRIWKVLRESK